MLKSDLKQIKKIVDESVDNAINTSVKKIVDESVDNAINTSVKKIVDQSLDEKLDQRFKKNKEDMDAMEERIMISTQEEFSVINDRFNKVDQRFNKIDKTLETKANESTLLDWADNRILELELNSNKVKYLHIKEWKGLPSASKIKEALIKEGLE
jgi:hypothetical protein